MKTLARTLPPLTLLEWGGILIYFYFSGRIAAFLHPMFRPLVLATGFLLVATAACVAFFPEEKCAHAHDDGSSHEHEGFSAKSLFTFLILLLPLALAAFVSPDDYGATIIKNRGLVLDIRGLPTIRNEARKKEGAPTPNESNAVATVAPPLVAQENEPPLPSVETTEPTVERETTSAPAAVQSSPAPTIVRAKRKTKAQPLPTKAPVENEDGTTTEQVGDATVTYKNDFLTPDKKGNIKAQVTDLLYAAQEPGTRKDFEGKRVELIGQFVTEKTSAANRKDARSFNLLRLVMVCCAADMMPAAVKVQPATKFERTKEMGWLKIAGVCHFHPRAKQIDEDGIDYGNYPEPVIVADQITATKAPREKYIY